MHEYEDVGDVCGHVAQREEGDDALHPAALALGNMIKSGREQPINYPENLRICRYTGKELFSFFATVSF